jgi:hypothetical protein
MILIAQGEVVGVNLERNDVSDWPPAPDMRTKAICWRRIFPSQEGSLIKFLEPDQSDKTDMSASDGTSIYQNDPLQNFGNRQPRIYYTISYIRISIRRTMEKTLKSEKKGLPLVPRYVGMCRTDTSKIGAR